MFDPLTWFLISTAVANTFGAYRKGQAQKKANEQRSRQESLNAMVSSLGGGMHGSVPTTAVPQVQEPIASQLGSLMSQLAPLIPKSPSSTAPGGLKAPAANAITDLERMLARLRNPDATRPQGSFQGFRRR